MKGIFGYTSLNGQKSEYICAHMNVYQKRTSAEEDFNNQVDRVIHFVDTSQPLSPATSDTGQWAHEQPGHSGRVGGYT